ncbi:MAG: hypothetical protein KKB34_05110 [Bacteroidetes bacterium]|nr:hypothetical protein [Bacteroidota bacterium]
MNKYRVEISYKLDIVAASYVGDTVTITTSTKHGYSVGDKVEIYGVGGLSVINNLYSAYAITGIPNEYSYTIHYDEPNGVYTSGGYSTVWWDVSDFVIASGPVDFIKRNLNYELVAPSVEVTVSAAYNQTSLDEWGSLIELNSRLNSATHLRFLENDSVFFLGVIKNKVPDEDALTFKYNVFDNFIIMKDFYVDYETLMSTLQTGSSFQYTSSDNEGYPNARVTWVIECMLKVAGFPSVAFVNFGTQDIVKETFDNVSWTERSYSRSNVLIDVNMLFAINQEYAMNHTRISANNISGYNSEGMKISFWDFINAFCSDFRVTKRYAKNQYGINSYIFTYEALEGANSVTDPDLVFYKKTVSVEKRKPNVNIEIKAGIAGTGAASRLLYSTTPADALSSLYRDYKKGSEDIQHYNNLVWLVENTTGSSLDVYSYPFTGGSLPATTTARTNFFNINDGVGSAKKDALVKDYIKTDLKTLSSVGYSNTMNKSIGDVETLLMSITEIEFK